MSHLSDLVQADHEKGVMAASEICKKKLTDNLQVLIKQFTSEEKQE